MLQAKHGKVLLWLVCAPMSLAKLKDRMGTAPKLASSLIPTTAIKISPARSKSFQAEAQYLLTEKSTGLASAKGWGQLPLLKKVGDGDLPDGEDVRAEAFAKYRAVVGHNNRSDVAKYFTEEEPED